MENDPDLLSRRSKQTIGMRRPKADETAKREIRHWISIERKNNISVHPVFAETF